jgi:hypothetical protein
MTVGHLLLTSTSSFSIAEELSARTSRSPANSISGEFKDSAHAFGGLPFKNLVQRAPLTGAAGEAL